MLTSRAADPAAIPVSAMIQPGPPAPAALSVAIFPMESR